MDHYELKKQGEFWVFKRKDSQDVLKFYTKEEGISFCQEFTKDFGGIFEIIELDNNVLQQ